MIRSQFEINKAIKMNSTIQQTTLPCHLWTEIYEIKNELEINDAKKIHQKKFKIVNDEYQEFKDITECPPCDGFEQVDIDNMTFEEKCRYEDWEDDFRSELFREHWFSAIDKISGGGGFVPVE